MMLFTDRADAGDRLAQVLRSFKSKDTLILALPRGGVVLGAAVAQTLRAPLGMVLVRKIGHPYSPEYAIGAVVHDYEPVLNTEEALSVSETWLQDAIEQAQLTNASRAKQYDASAVTLSDVSGKTIVVVDDGIATGLTMQAVIRAIKSRQPKRLIVAVPVASMESIGHIEPLVDDLIVLENPEEFRGAIGLHYKVFEQVDDDEVRRLLSVTNKRVTRPA